MSAIVEIFNLIKEKEIKFVDFRFTDLRGKWHHITYLVDKVNEATFKNGIMFDGSSIVGWKAINNSDMTLMPDPTTAFIDPFTAEKTLAIICNIIEPTTGDQYLRDPRLTAKRAEEYLVKRKIGNKAYFGPELEFFIFDDVRYKTSMNETFLYIDTEEGPYNSGKKSDANNLGHRAGVKGNYFSLPPIDTLHDIRSEMLEMLKSVGLVPVMHHAEVAPSQCELGFEYDSLVKSADNVQKYKYVVHNVARNFGKTATFMPKPIKGDNGSGMHVHQSIWQNNEPLFSGNKYNGLSEKCLHYIGGIIKHAKALNAFTNPTTNSYKRLVPGFEAPVLLAYSLRNRSASIRIPFGKTEAEKRIEVRFVDGAANPYYAFAAMLMAGIDGIENKIDPGEAIEKNLYELNLLEANNIKTVSGSLREALQELSKDRDFLKKGDVFSDEQIDAYINLKMNEIEEIDQTPHPLEFSLYYSC